MRQCNVKSCAPSWLTHATTTRSWRKSASLHVPPNLLVPMSSVIRYKTSWMNYGMKNTLGFDRRRPLRADKITTKRGGQSVQCALGDATRSTVERSREAELEHLSHVAQWDVQRMYFFLYSMLYLVTTLALCRIRSGSWLLSWWYLQRRSWGVLPSNSKALASSTVDNGGSTAQSATGCWFGMWSRHVCGAVCISNGVTQSGTGNRWNAS